MVCVRCNTWTWFMHVRTYSWKLEANCKCVTMWLCAIVVRWCDCEYACACEWSEWSPSRVYIHTQRLQSMTTTTPAGLAFSLCFGCVCVCCVLCWSWNTRHTPRSLGVRLPTSRVLPRGTLPPSATATIAIHFHPFMCEHRSSEMLSLAYSSQSRVGVVSAFSGGHYMILHKSTNRICFLLT